MELLLQRLRTCRNEATVEGVRRHLQLFESIGRDDAEWPAWRLSRYNIGTAALWDTLLQTATEREYARWVPPQLPDGSTGTASLHLGEDPPSPNKARLRTLEFATFVRCLTPAWDLTDRGFEEFVKTGLRDVTDPLTAHMVRVVAEYTTEEVGVRAAAHTCSMLVRYCHHVFRGNDTQALAWIALAQATVYNPVVGRMNNSGRVCILVP